MPKACAAVTINPSELGMNRTTVYKILIHLSKLGLVIKTLRHGILSYYAESPEEKLIKQIEKQQERLKVAEEIILERLPSFMAANESSGKLPKIRYYEGIEGIKRIYELILKAGVDYYRYGDITKIYGTLGEFTDEYIRKRNALGITAHAIMPYPKDENKAQAIQKDEEELRKSLYIPQELFNMDGEIRIFGDKVAILSLRKESPIGVVIESETIASMFQSIFMLTWQGYGKKAKKLA